jgi:hypothetical protein
MLECWNNGILGIKNRFLADAFLKQKQPGKAIASPKSIIEIADPESEHADWARMKRLRAKK